MVQMNSSQTLIKLLYIVALPFVLFANFERASAWRLQADISQKDMTLNNELPEIQTSSIYLPNSFISRSISKPISKLISKPPKDLAQKVPKDLGAPTGRRKGGASRSDQCPGLKTPITALVPGGKSNNKSFFASTIAQYPTIWLFLPKLPARMKFGEFVLQDKNGDDVLRKMITLPQRAGVISITPPENPQYALKENHKYHWYFQVYCGDPRNEPDYIYVDAWLQRIPLNPNLKKQLEITKQDRYAVYSENDLWYDAITYLGKLRDCRRRACDYGNPNSKQLTQHWANLLKTAHLEEFVDIPIIKHYPLQD